MENVTFTGRICGSSFKKGVKSYNMQGNTLKVFSGKIEIKEQPDSAPAIIGDTIRFLYNNEPHVGTVVKEVVTRKLLHVSVRTFSRPCIIGWEEVVSVVYDGDDDELDSPVDTVEFEGDYLTAAEFDILLGNHTCCQCGMDLEFVSGHVAVPISDEVICADCNDTNMSYFVASGS